MIKVVQLRQRKKEVVKNFYLAKYTLENKERNRFLYEFYRDNKKEFE